MARVGAPQQTGPAKPVAWLPSRLNVFDAGCPPLCRLVARPSGNRCTGAAYGEWQASGREWHDVHDTPGLEAAMALRDEPFDPAAEGYTGTGSGTPGEG